MDVGGGLGVDYDGSQTNFDVVDELLGRRVRQRHRLRRGRRLRRPRRAAPEPHHRGRSSDDRAPRGAGVRRARLRRDGRRQPPEAPAAKTRPRSARAVGDLPHDHREEPARGAPRRDPRTGAEPEMFNLGPRRSSSEPRPRASTGRSAGRCCGRADRARRARRRSRTSRRRWPTSTTATSRCSSRCPTLGHRPAVPDHADPPARREPDARARRSPTSPATPTARSTGSSTSAT